MKRTSVPLLVFIVVLLATGCGSDNNSGACVGPTFSVQVDQLDTVQLLGTHLQFSAYDASPQVAAWVSETLQAKYSCPTGYGFVFPDPNDNTKSLCIHAVEVDSFDYYVNHQNFPYCDHLWSLQGPNGFQDSDFIKFLSYCKSTMYCKVRRPEPLPLYVLCADYWGSAESSPTFSFASQPDADILFGRAAVDMVDSSQTCLPINRSTPVGAVFVGTIVKFCDEMYGYAKGTCSYTGMGDYVSLLNHTFSHELCHELGMLRKERNTLGQCHDTLCECVMNPMRAQALIDEINKVKGEPAGSGRCTELSSWIATYLFGMCVEHSHVEVVNANGSHRYVCSWDQVDSLYNVQNEQ